MKEWLFEKPVGSWCAGLTKLDEYRDRGVDGGVNSGTKRYNIHSGNRLVRLEKQLRTNQRVAKDLSGWDGQINWRK